MLLLITNYSNILKELYITVGVVSKCHQVADFHGNAPCNLSWAQKHNSMMSMDYEITLPIKRGGVSFSLMRFEVDCHRYTLKCLR